MRRSPQKEFGYVISIMLVMLFSVVGVGLLFGMAPLRDAYLKREQFQNSIDLQILYDNDGSPGGLSTILGRAAILDEHETPLLAFSDFNQSYAGTSVNYRVLIGVRDDRFTSRQQIYYTTDNCTTQVSTGNIGDIACIMVPGSEDGGAFASPSYQLATQAGVSIGSGFPQKSYGVGRKEDNIDPTDYGLPGWLWRQTNSDCDASSIRSRWNSKSLSPSPVGMCETLPGLSATSGSLKAAEMVPDPDSSDLNVFDNFFANRPFQVNSPIDPSQLTSGTPSFGSGE